MAGLGQKPLRCPPPQQGRLWEEPTEEIGPTSDSVGILAVCGGEDVKLETLLRARACEANKPDGLRVHRKPERAPSKLCAWALPFPSQPAVTTTTDFQTTLGDYGVRPWGTLT